MVQAEKYKAVIFDLDGLILDTERLAHLAWKTVMSRAGYVLEDQIYYKIIGLTVEDMPSIMKDAYGQDFPVDDLNQQRIEYMNEHIKSRGVDVKKGVYEFLDLLDERKIQSRLLFAGNIIRQPVFNNMRESNNDFIVVGDLDNTDKVMNDSFWVGVYPGMSDEKIDYMISQINELLN